MGEPRVKVVDDTLVLKIVDEDVDELEHLAKKARCLDFVRANQDRILHFVGRVHARGLDPSDVVIVLIDVDDACGGPLADVLMPGQDWQATRDQGLTPIARGLVQMDGVEEMVGVLDPEEQRTLRELLCDRTLAVVAVAAETCPVLPASAALPASPSDA